MRHVLILNPAAGKTDSTKQLMQEAEIAFGKAGLQYKIELTQYPGHAAEIAKSYRNSDEQTILYACGGDGTISEVAQALYDAENLILAPVAVGTGNDFVKSLGSEAGANFTISELVENGEIVSADMLVAGGRVSLNIVSVGLDASVTKNVARFKRLPLVSGAMAYKLSTAYCFFTKVKYRMAFEIDGETIPAADYVFAIAANGRFYGGGFHAAPLADIQDGLIDFIAIPARPRIKLLPMISRYQKGEHLERYDFIKLIRCKKIKYISDEPVELNCDGEVADSVDPVVEVIAGGMKLLVPKGCAITNKK